MDFTVSMFLVSHGIVETRKKRGVKMWQSYNVFIICFTSFELFIHEWFYRESLLFNFVYGYTNCSFLRSTVLHTHLNVRTSKMDTSPAKAEVRILLKCKKSSESFYLSLLLPSGCEEVCPTSHPSLEGWVVSLVSLSESKILRLPNLRVPYKTLEN